MLNEIVLHNKYGKGKIVGVKDNYIKVAFQDSKEEKIFLYPNGFEKFLVFEDAKLQEDANNALRELKINKKKEEEAKRYFYHQMEIERKKEQLELMKRRRKAAKERAEREKKKKEKEINNV